MRCVLSSLLLPLLFAFAGDAAADCLVAPFSKEIRIKNNSPETIFPVISAPKYDPNNPNAADLWMQAQCETDPKDAKTRRFSSTLVYRAYINLPADVPTGGVPPGSTVTITLPFYTKLKEVNKGNLGSVNDQFIDWWNSARIYFFYGEAALDSAIIDGSPKDIDFGKNVPNQIKPTCTIVTSPPTNCTIVFKAHTIDPRANIPFQLQEYTFASATGPVPGGVLPAGSPFTIETQWVNYNVSSLDSVYLPVAMGPIKVQDLDPKGPTTYLGDGADVPTFNQKLSAFSKNGGGWPYFIPVYFADPSKESVKKWPPLETKGPPCSFIKPFTDANPAIKEYLFPKLPGTANLLIESYRKVQVGNRLGTIVPPLLSSQPSNFSTVPNYSGFRCDAPDVPTFTEPPALGTSGKAVIDLWIKCTTSQIANDTCSKIKEVNQFFLNNYNQGLRNRESIPKECQNPDLPATIFAVYGWVPIKFPLYPKAGEKQCEGPALKETQSTPNYNTAITTYCELQYNYLTPGLLPEFVFNPYTKLIHDTLGSTAYAFSIDDEQAFRHLVAPGVIITVGGVAGLDDETPSPKPNPDNFKQFCRGPTRASR